MMEDFLFKVSGENKNLAVHEIQSLNKSMKMQEVKEGFFTAKCNYSSFWNRLAFTKRIFKVHFRGANHALERWQREHKIIASQKLQFESIKVKSFSKEEVFGILTRSFDKISIDLNTGRSFALFEDEEEFFLLEEVWRNEEDFLSRKNQNRPAPHPTSLSPKLARCLVNLSEAKEAVLDPFCGSGGILLESSLMNLRSIGSDIDPIMIKRCEKNLEHFGVLAHLEVKDALTIKGSFEAIVTDLPYGKNSKADDLDLLFSTFLDRAHKVTNSLAVCFPSFVDHEKIVSLSSWKVVFCIVWPLNRKLSKVIYKLNKK